jgi:hypothetical protein
MLNVGKRSVERARTVIDKGTPEIVKAVESGLITVSKAATQLSPPKGQISLNEVKPCARHGNKYFQVTVPETGSNVWAALGALRTRITQCLDDLKHNEAAKDIIASVKECARIVGRHLP